jgi:tellurite methyltransferase
MGGEAEQDRPLTEGLEHEAPLAMLQVPEAAVDEPAGSGTGPGAEVVALDQGGTEAAHGGIPKDVRPRDAAADDQEIELPRRKVTDPGAHRDRHISGTVDTNRPSPWFEWHRDVITRGARVLDLACGTGRHSLAAAALGADVTAVDKNPARLDLGRQAAKARNLTVTWLEWDLSTSLPPLGTFDLLLMFNYLDRARMPEFLGYVRPGGYLLMETFLVDQRAFDWGPTSDAHLLQRGELVSLIGSLDILHGRESLEPVEGVQWSAVASVLARKRVQ